MLAPAPLFGHSDRAKRSLKRPSSSNRRPRIEQARAEGKTKSKIRGGAAMAPCSNQPLPSRFAQKRRQQKSLVCNHAQLFRSAHQTVVPYLAHSCVLRGREGVRRQTRGSAGPDRAHLFAERPRSHADALVEDHLVAQATRHARRSAASFRSASAMSFVSAET